MDSTNIDKETYYPLNQIFKMKVFPWIKSYVTLRNMVLKDMKNGGTRFKAILTGEGEGSRYQIKGEHLIALIETINREGIILDKPQT